ncbi:MAG TPA: PLP-dependent aminotransferase family protein [Solirubrobacteraceae bacterium]|jgi:DNA-binding transcriptional MocR family regulator
MPNGNTGAAVIADLERVVAAARPGERLPSVRELMARHRVGPGTVQQAVGALVARGVVEARPGRGTFVAEGPAAPAAPAAPADLGWQSVALGSSPYAGVGPLEDLRRLPPPGDVLLSTGYLPADLQPRGALGQALARAARRPDVWGRVPLEGVPALREHFAAEVGGGAEAADVLICPGGQSALNACLRALAPPGAPVVVESPTYSGMLVLARAAGLRPVPVPSDAGGVRPELLADALRRSGARVAYLQPTFANPHGTTLAADRRADVLAAAADAGAFIVEDIPFHELALDGAPTPPPLWHDDRHGHVVSVRSLTKSASPGMRVAAVLARGPAAARIRAARIVDDLLVAGPLQEAAVELVAAPAWARHLRTLRATLRERRDALAATVDRELGPGRLAALPRGGFHLWVALDPHEDDIDTAARAARAGVVVSAGRWFFPAEATGPHLRLSFAGAPPDRLAEGVRRLAAARG